MDFYKAVKIAKANERLVGKIVDGAAIEEIIIIPTDEKQLESYKQLFAQYLDAQRAIVPFMSSDVEVYALFNKRMIRSSGFFMVCSVENLPKEMGAIIDI